MLKTVLFPSPTMSISVAMDKSGKSTRDNANREHTLAALGYDKVPNLIRCNNGRSCGCMVAKKRFIKTESTDSGGSFDFPDNTERVGTTLVANANNDAVLPSTDTQKSSNSVPNVHSQVSVTELSHENYPSIKDTEKSSFRLTSEEIDNVCKTKDNFLPEATLGVCLPVSASLGKSASDSLIISNIFSKLAKNLVSKKSQQNSEKSGSFNSVTELEVERSCEVDAASLFDTDHLMKTFGDRDGRVGTVDTSTHSVSAKCDLIHADGDITAKNEMCALRGMSNEVSSGKCVQRSLSDSGSSTGSNELSDGEKVSLNGSNDSGDVRKSILSLDLGISIASLESLGEKSFADLDNRSEDRQLLQMNIAARASENDLSRPRMDLCVDNFLTRNQRAIDTLSAGDTEAFSVETGTDADELYVCSGSLSSCESNASIELMDFFSFAEEVLEGSCHNVTPKSETCSDSGSSPASPSTKQTPPASFCVKKKRDFHLWEHDLVNICPCDTDLSSPEYLNSSPEGIDSLTITQINADIDKKVNSKQSGGSLESKGLHQTKKKIKYSSSKPRRRRLGVCSIDGIKDLPNRKPQSVSNDKSTHYNTSATISGGTKMEASCSIDPGLITANPLNDAGLRTINSHLINSVAVNSSTDENSTKQRGLVHTNCLKTVGTAIRRISNPNKSFQLPNIFGSNKCKYDFELASMACSRSYPSTPAKPDRQNRIMQSFSSSKSSAFHTATLCKVTSHLRDDPSPSLTPSSSPALLSKRFRSYSVDACSAPSRRRENSGPTNQTLDPGTVTSPNNPFEAGFYKQHGNSILLDALFDAKKAERNKLPYSYNGSDGRAPKKAQQFGLSLNDIKNNTGRIIPLPVEETVEYLKVVGGDEVEGLFRRCARVSTMKEVQEKYDDGEKIDYEVYCDPHLAAAILKKFLRELQEPLMTYDLFEPITRLHFLETNKQLTEVQRILQDELPEDNYIILKYVFQFLRQVVMKSDINHMTAENIATVFGPNIAWPKGQANLATVEQAVKFALILVQNFDDVFLR